MRIDKVYTRSGDNGLTALIGGKKVPKHHVRVEAYGAVDELNCAVGLCRSSLSAPDREALDPLLLKIQNRLFDLGSVLACPPGSGWKGMPLPGPESVLALENSMDSMQSVLKPLHSFVLPGGSWSNAWFHHCRAACRAAERRVSALMTAEKTPVGALIYLNRLSDWFFVAARFVAHRSGSPEVLWEYPERNAARAATAKQAPVVRPKRLASSAKGSKAPKKPGRATRRAR